MKHGYQPTIQNHERPVPPTAGSAVIPPRASWDCAARKQGTSGGNSPTDCDWPVCGCDPYADKVISALQESGHHIASASTAPDQGDEEVAERIVQRLLSAKYDLRDVAGRFEAINIVREEVGRQTFAPSVRSLDKPRFTENDVTVIKERLERAFYDAGGFHGQLVEYAARTALPIVLDLITATPSSSDWFGAKVGHSYGIIDPDYARVFTIARCLAWQEGYAVLMHGSFTRDLDLLAVPWGERPCAPEHLIARIQEAAGLRMALEAPSRKHHGRLVWTLLFETLGDPRFVDIGVMPRLASYASTANHQEG